MKRLRTKRISALSVVAPSILSLYRTAGLLELPQDHWTYPRFIGPNAGSLELPRVY